MFKNINAVTQEPLMHCHQVLVLQGSHKRTFDQPPYFCIILLEPKSRMKIGKCLLITYLGKLFPE